MVQDYRQLRVWQVAQALALDCYKATSGFPGHELYGLRAQIRRAAVSVPANIAEGRARGREAEYSHFLRISLGSAAELESHLGLAHALGFIEETVFRELAHQVALLKSMLWRLIKRIEADHVHRKS
jgi:four helix bundle protein